MNTGRNSKQTTCLCRDTGGKGTLLAQRTSFNTLDNWGHKIPTQSKRKKKIKGKKKKEKKRKKKKKKEKKKEKKEEEEKRQKKKRKDRKERLKGHSPRHAQCTRLHNNNKSPFKIDIKSTTR